MIPSFVLIVARVKLGVKTAIAGDFDRFIQFENIALVVEHAACGDEIRLLLLRVSQFTGDAIETDVAERLQVLLRCLRLDPVVPTVGIEAFVVRVLHFEIVGNDLRHLQVRNCWSEADVHED